MDVLRLDLGSRPGRLGRAVATIGNFDGLHVGHRKIIGEAVAAAARRGERSVVVTFDPHPVKVLHPEAGFRCLKTLDQRLHDLAGMGVGAVAIVRFDRTLSRATPRAFVECILARALAVSEVLIGRSFRFGRGRAGDVALLRALGRELGFTTRAVRPVTRGGRPVSSSRIRTALFAGDVSEAARLLGARFRVEGTIVRGAGRGTRSVFPTANLQSANECLPAPGVYATRAELGGRTYAAASFLGQPATFGERRSVFESHLLDFDGGDLYGEDLAVEFVRRLRGQVKFPSAAALKAQIAHDLDRARKIARL